MATAILDRLAPRFDAIVHSIYRAGSGLCSWLDPVVEVSRAFDAWTVQLLAVSKDTRAISYSFAAGSAAPEAAFEYVRYYHRIDPRLGRVLSRRVGDCFCCEEHFDADFVATDPFYQGYLIPAGGRYLYGAKLHDAGTSAVMFGHVGKVTSPPLCREEKAAFARIAEHFAKALEYQTHVDGRSTGGRLEAAILERFRCGAFLIDERRRVSHCNGSARALVESGDPLHIVDGVLGCRDAATDSELTLALSSLFAPAAAAAQSREHSKRMVLALRRRDGRALAATLSELPRPNGARPGAPQVMFSVFDSTPGANVDPMLLSIAFDLTPAEARIAALIANGCSTRDCASELGVKMSTVRTQLLSIYRKTGSTGQADLVRAVLPAALLG